MHAILWYSSSCFMAAVHLLESVITCKMKSLQYMKTILISIMVLLYIGCLDDNLDKFRDSDASFACVINSLESFQLLGQFGLRFAEPNQ